MSRRSSAALRSLTLLPSTRMSPSVMSIMRLTIRIAVVLPQPEGPTSTQISPAGTSSERLWIAGSDWPAYRFVTPRYSTDAAEVVDLERDSPGADIRAGMLVGADFRPVPRLS